MIVDAKSSPPPPVASPEKPLSDSGASNETTQLHSVNDGVDLIGDAASWPSLSESTRPSPKSTPAPAPSPPVPEAPIATPQGSAGTNSSQKHKHANTTPNPSFSPNHNRQRSSNRGGSGRGGGPSRGGGFSHPPPQTMPPPPPMPPVFYQGFEGQIRGPFFYGNNFQERPITGFVGHPRPIDHHRGGHVGRLRGDGVHNYNHANYRPHQELSAPQGFHHRDVRFPQPGPPMGFPIPPQPLLPFPFMHGPLLPPEPFMGMPPPYGGQAPLPPPSLSPPPPVPIDLRTKLLNQINYYFSDENLIKDYYLKSQMDDGGWVPVSLIASFRKVQEETRDIDLIVDSLRSSAVVEVQGDKMRRRNDWRRWIPTNSVTEASAELNSIARYLQNVSIEEAHADLSSSSTANASLSPREILT